MIGGARISTYRDFSTLFDPDMFELLEVRRSHEHDVGLQVRHLQDPQRLRHEKNGLVREAE